jgi:RNA polymerase sigma factor for flagellar operon FliA
MEEYLEWLQIIVKTFYRKKRPPKISYDDLYSVALVALWNAWKKFDPKRNVKFTSYAFTRIRGAMLDYLREESGFRIRLGKSQRTKRSQEVSLNSGEQALIEKFAVKGEDFVQRDLIQKIIELCHGRERQFIEFKLAGYTDAESAKRMGESLANLYFIRKRLLSRLKERFGVAKESGGTDSEARF